MSADLHQLSRDLTDRGKIIEAGWIGLRIAAVNPDAPQVHIDDMRQAFFAGAAHLFASILCVLDPGEEATEKDLLRLDAIDAELKAFIGELEAKHLTTSGSA